MALVGLSCLAAPAWGGERVEIGQRAPRFVLPVLKGKQQMRSSEVFGAMPLTMLIFWDSNCPDCLQALLRCRDFAPRADSMGVRMLSINFDQGFMAPVRAFVKEERLPFPVLWDAHQLVVRAYRAEGYSFSLFLVDRQETVRYAHYDHPPDVLAELTQQVDAVLAQIRSSADEDISSSRPTETY
ncbi:MAG: redoxin domain-containing protein [Pseudomonadota bacterium]